MEASHYRRVKDAYLELIALDRAARPDALRALRLRDEKLAVDVDRLLRHDESEPLPFEGMARSLAALIPRVEAASLSSAQEAGVELEPGRLLADRYRVEGLLGRGGMGTVYLAHDRWLEASVALKVPDPAVARSLAEDTASVSSAPPLLVREAAAARAIEHPNVCRLFDVEIHREEDLEIPFLTLEHVPGEDLGRRLEREGPLPAAELRSMALQLVRALEAIHSGGVLHRDLKPANVLLDTQGRVRVTDFGVAGFGHPARPGEMMGTPGYVAPEVLEGAEGNAAGDLYSLGVVLYEAATGHRAPIGEPISLEALAGPWDPVLVALIDRCLAHDPNERPTDAAQAMAALEADDPLAGILELGNAVSPAVIAASQARGVLDRRRGTGIAVLAACLVAFLAWSSPRIESLDAAGLDRSPDSLAERARQLAEAIDPERRVVDRAWGLGQIPGERYPGVPYPRGMAQAGQDTFFWYKEASFELANWNGLELAANGGRVHLLEPPLETLGTLTVSFDLAGRLILYQHQPLPTPGSIPSGAERPKAPVPTDPIWQPLLTAAELDPSVLTATELLVPLATSADRRATWTLATATGPLGGKELDDPEQPPVVVETGSLRGRPVLFAPLQLAYGIDLPRLQRQELGFELLFSAAPLLVLLVAVPAWRHLRSGRGDPWGASRLALFVFGSTYASFLLRAEHLRSPAEEALLLVLGLGGPLIWGSSVWLLYMGCEPWIRRTWPRSLVSWNRILRGDLHDPAVASHLLSGLAFGGWLVACHLAQTAWTATAAGIDLPVPARLPEGFWRLRHGLGEMLLPLPEGVWTSLFFATVLVVFHRWVRPPWLATTFAVTFLGLVGVLGAQEPMAAVVCFVLLQVMPSCWLLRRYGILPQAVALAVLELWRGLVPGWYPERWYALLGAVGLGALLAAIGGSAWLHARTWASRSRQRRMST